MKEELYNEIYTTDEKPTDYKAILFEYLIHWPWFVATLLICVVGAWMYLRFQTPVYTISSSVLIKQDDRKGGSSSSPLSAMEDLGMLTMANNFDNEVEILQSRTLIKKVVNTLGLNISYSEAGSFSYDRDLYKSAPVRVWMTPEEADRLSAPLQVSLTYHPDGKTEAHVTCPNGEEVSKTFDRLPAVFVTPQGTLSLTADTLQAVNEKRTFQAVVASPTRTAAGYRGRLSAEPTSKQTTIVRLNINDTNIRRGTDFLNTLVELYNEDANDDKNIVAKRTADFIDKRIDIINKELSLTEDSLASYKQRTGLTDINADAQMALQGNTEYNQKRAENTTQLRLIEFLRSYIENPENRHEVIPTNVGLEDQGLGTLISQYNEMLIERKRLLRTSSEENPAVVNLNISIEAARKNVLTSVASVEKGLQITRADLDREARRFEARISDAPQQEKALLGITRQQEIKADLYLMLLQKREENAITLEATANNGRTIEEPLANSIPVSPKGKMIYLIALILGIAFPAAFIYLSRLLRFKIESRSDVEHITSLPIVGDIPQIAHEANESIVIQENRNGIMEEVFRSVRTNIQYMLQSDQKVILFTSTTSGEGKSFNAGNLAVSFAFMGKKVVIIGLDIRKPGLNKVFRLSHKEKGITQYLADPIHTDLISLCQQSDITPNLYILPGGTVPPNPTELVAREALDKAIATLKEHFDYVILDTAPIGMVTDTQVIARVADLSVYVCRASYTHKSDYELINELHRDNKLPNLCTLINGIDMDKRSNGYYYGYGKYGHYGKYGYGKKYGYGYGYGYGKEK